MPLANTDGYEIEATYGVDDSAHADLLGQLPTDPDEFVENFWDNVAVTITGFRAERKPSQREGGGIMSSIIMSQIDDDGNIQNRRFFVADPTAGTGRRSGKPRYARTQDWGLLVSSWAALGVSSRAEVAVTYHYNTEADLVGLRYVQKVAGAGRNPNYPPYEAVEILGIDNDIRAEAGLPPAYLVGDEPKPAPKRSPAAPVAAKAAPAVADDAIDLALSLLNGKTAEAWQTAVVKKAAVRKQPDVLAAIQDGTLLEQWVDEGVVEEQEDGTFTVVE